METTYSTTFSITFYILLCEGHSTSEVQIKASGMKAVAPPVDEGHDQTDC